MINKSFSAWIDKTANVRVQMTTPFQLKTNSEVGSDDLVLVHFYDATNQEAGGLKLFFTSPMKYELFYCMTRQVHLTNLPEEKEKVWTFYRSADWAMIVCNGVVLVKYQLSSCSNPGNDGRWDREIHYIQFHHVDTATDFYRAANPGL